MMVGSGARFSSKVHVVLICAMIVSLLLILQQWSFLLYKVGIVALIVTVLIQIPFGNIPGEANARRSLLLFLRFFSIIVLIFVVAIFLAPYLVKIGRK
jgi:hypothetical protein